MRRGPWRHLHVHQTRPDSTRVAGVADVEIGLKEWAIIVEAPSVGAGETEFDAHNEGKVPHELCVLKTDTKAAT